MSDKKQDNTLPSASDDFRNKDNGGINNESKEEKHEVEPPYEVEPPKLMNIPDFYSSFPWGL